MPEEVSNHFCIVDQMSFLAQDGLLTILNSRNSRSSQNSEILRILRIYWVLISTSTSQHHELVR